MSVIDASLASTARWHGASFRIARRPVVETYDRAMADITGRVRKRAAHLFDDGEVVLVAILVEPKGTYGAGSVAVAALPRLSTALLANRAASDRPDGFASTFPSKPAAVVVTDRRVAVIPSNGIGFSAITAEYARTDLVVADNVGRGLGRRLTLAFVDGSSVVVDVQRGQPFELFAASLGDPP